MSTWFLEGYLYQEEKMHRVVIDAFPFVIGRGKESDLTLNYTQISRTHCTLQQDRPDTLTVRDNHSTNGTTLNGETVQNNVTVQHGDVIALGGIELRLVLLTAEQTSPDKTVIAAAANPHGASLRGMREFEELMTHKQVTAYFQAIFTPSGAVVAHEALGRGRHPNLPESPFHLFSLAHSLGQQVALSEMLRERALELSLSAGITTPLYLNTDASELAQLARLIEHLSLLRDRAPLLPMVIEIHEEGVSSLTDLKHLATALHELRLEFAYDDFGAGRARLMELIEVPPSVLKLDLSLIRGIDSASDAHSHMLTSLISVAHSVGAKTLAEGVETAEELATCSDLGIDLIQGYWLGKPIEGFQQRADH